VVRGEAIPDYLVLKNAIVAYLVLKGSIWDKTVERDKGAARPIAATFAVGPSS
jgi:hypothetical protein